MKKILRFSGNKQPKKKIEENFFGEKNIKRIIFSAES